MQCIACHLIVYYGMAWYCISFGVIARYHTVMYSCYSAPANYRVVHLVIFFAFFLPEPFLPPGHTQLSSAAHFSVFQKFSRRKKCKMKVIVLEAEGAWLLLTATICYLLKYIQCVSKIHKILRHIAIHQVLACRQERLWSVFNR